MAYRTMTAGLIGLAVLAASRAASGAAITDNLYTALLNANMTNLPAGVSRAQTTVVDLTAEDRSAGIIGMLQVTFASNDPTAKVNYVCLPDATRANTVAQRTNETIRASGARPLFLPFAPNTNCAADGSNGRMACTATADRVVVVSFATQMEGLNNNARGPVSLAGPLIKAALDHLANVKRTSGRN